MELDDLKNQWTEYGGKLDEAIQLNARVLRDSGMRKAGSSLKWALRGILFEQLTSLPALGLLGVFVSNHLSEPRYLVPAIVLDIFAILSVASCGYQLGTLHSIDFGQTVLATQKKLEQVRVLRLATIKWAFLLGPVLWVPVAIVGLKGVFGVDGYTLFPGGWLAVNLIAGAAISVALFWLSKRFSPHVGRSKVLQRLMDDLAGRNLGRARAFLGDISSFEHEDALA